MCAEAGAECSCSAVAPPHQVGVLFPPLLDLCIATESGVEAWGAGGSLACPASENEGSSAVQQAPQQRSSSACASAQNGRQRGSLPKPHKQHNYTSWKRTQLRESEARSSRIACSSGPRVR